MKRLREPDGPQPPSSPQPASGAGVENAAVSANNDDRSEAGLDLEGPPAKFIDVDPEPSINGPDGGRGTTTPTSMITCLLHRERVEFARMETYETHYKKEHLNRCLECRRNFPSPLYLSLHGDECHDPFVAVKRDRGEHTYGCFVEGCVRKCASPEKRRRHLIDKHSFPKNFFFAITQYGTDGRTSLLDEGFRRQAGPPPQHHHRRKSSAVDSGGGSSIGSVTKSPLPLPLPIKTTTQHQAASSGDGRQRRGNEGGVDENAASRKTADAMEEDSDSDDTDDNRSSSDSDSDSNGDAGQTPDVQMDDLATAMSAVSFVPRSVRFGRGRKAGFARR